MENFYSPYCEICTGCGEDGCCPASNCQQHPDGKYCEIYLKELKFGYLMYHKLMGMVEEDPKYKEEISEVFDELWDRIFDDNVNKKEDE